MTEATYWVESEFDGGLHATCGPNALANGECYGLQRYIGVPTYGQTATMVIYRRMRAAGRCDANGASTGGGLEAQARADNFKTARLGFKNPLSRAEWLGFYRARFAEGAVVVTEIAHGGRLRDAYSGAGMDAGPDLAFHYILACAYHPGGPSVRAGGRVLPEGVWCADGDSDANNPIRAGRRTRVIAGHVLQFYPLSTLDAATPCDLIAVYPKVALPASSPAPAPDPSAGLPVGWHWNATAGELTAPNGVALGGGIGRKVYEDLRAGIWQAGYPSRSERKIVDGQGLLAFVAFGSAVLIWRQGYPAPRYATEAEMAALVAEGEYKAA